MRKKLVTSLLLAVAASLAGTWWFKRPAPLPEPRATPLVTELLGPDDEGFARVQPTWRFTFPDDHGAHPTYRMESWYFTGNLTTKEQRRFGFHLAFFRFALKPLPGPHRASSWAAREVYRGLFTLTDVVQNQFYSFERFSRAALGLSGASVAPVRVWIENWIVEVTNSHVTHPGFHLHAAQDGIKLDLALQSTKSVILLSQGSPRAEHASFSAPFHSYLVPRLMAQGTVQIGTETFMVAGQAWLDRAWGLLPVPGGPVLWDRFLLQLDDNREILGLGLRRRDDNREPLYTAMLIAPEGSWQWFSRGEIVIEVLKYWSSPVDGAQYPTHWRFRLPAQNIELDLAPEISAQEINLSLRYWAGAVHVTGRANGRDIQGSGHVELMGYAQTQRTAPSSPPSQGREK